MLLVIETKYHYYDVHFSNIFFPKGKSTLFNNFNGDPPLPLPMSPKHGEFLALEYLTWEPRTNNNYSIPHHPLPPENNTFVVSQKKYQNKKKQKYNKIVLKIIQKFTLITKKTRSNRKN